MREIKFRGKSLNTGEWVKGYYLVNRGGHYIAPDEFVNPLAKPSDYEVDPDTVGQYTGVKDIEGKEIYEGDVLRGHDTYVKWSQFNATYTIAGLELYRATMFGAKVIGNIHDNPELLER